MDVLRFIERLAPERRKRDYAKEIMALPDTGDVTPIIDAALAEHVPCSDAEAKALADILLHLPERQRAVMVLSLKDYTMPQIAERLGITTKVACHEFALAMGKLQHKGIDP